MMSNNRTLLLTVTLAWLALASSNVFSTPKIPTGLCINNTNCTHNGSVVAPTTINPEHFHPGYYYSVGNKDNESPEELFSPLNTLSEFVGAKRIYSWNKLEPREGDYDFSMIEADLAYLQSIDKRLWIQVSYKQFNGNRPPKTPRYMWDDSKYGCGFENQYYGTYKRKAQDGGWLPCYWNTNMRERFVALYRALGKRFNHELYIEGISMAETAVDTPSAKTQPDYDALAIKATYQAKVLAARKSFPDKTVFQLMNFAPYSREEFNHFGKWLVENEIGIGSPDIYLNNEALTTFIYPQYLKHHNQVPTGPDVQWKNYEKATPEEILLGAIELTNPWYMFWMRRDKGLDPYGNPISFQSVLEAIRKHGRLPAAKAFYDSLKK